MGIGTRLVGDYPTIPFLWKKSQMCKTRMGSIFLALAVHVLSKLQSQFSSMSAFCSLPLMQDRERMVEKLIATEGWGVMCVLVLPNSTNLLNREIKRLLCERVSFTMVSLLTDSTRSPSPKKRLTRLDTHVLLKQQIDLTPPTYQPHLKTAKYIFQIHILHTPQEIKDKLLFPLHPFFSYTP